MALSKKIKLDNGVVVNYHKIGYITNVINNQTIIYLESYIDEEKRNKEKEAIENKEPNRNIFKNSKYFSLPYDAEMDVIKAYNHLKNTDAFKGSKDV